MSISTYTNFAYSTLAAGIAAGATSASTQSGDGAKFPSAVPYFATLWNVTDYASADLDPNREIIKVTARATDTLTIVRGQQGTTDGAHNTGGKSYAIMQAVTATDLNDLVAKSGDDMSGVLGLLGGVKLPMTAIKTSAYTASAGDVVITVDNSGGAATVTLRAAANKQLILVNNVGASGAVVISVPGAEDTRSGSTIAATISLAAGSRQMFLGDGGTRTYRVL